jgi:hypothetical protein
MPSLDDDESVRERKMNADSLADLVNVAARLRAGQKADTPARPSSQASFVPSENSLVDMCALRDGR